MKIQVLVATATLALFASTTASAGKLVINSTNSSAGAVAVGDTFIAAGTVNPWGASGFVAGAGGRALAGSVSISARKGCGCGDRKLTVNNRSNGAVAVGNASSGSTSVSL